MSREEYQIIVDRLREQIFLNNIRIVNRQKINKLYEKNKIWLERIIEADTKNIQTIG